MEICTYCEASSDNSHALWCPMRRRSHEPRPEGYRPPERFKKADPEEEEDVPPGALSATQIDAAARELCDWSWRRRPLHCLPFERLPESQKNEVRAQLRLLVPLLQLPKVREHA